MMGMMTRPLPCVFCWKFSVSGADPGEDNVAETLTGMPDAGEPNMSLTRA